MAIKRLTDLERFHQSYAEDRAGCWIWQKFMDKDGYGQFRIGSRSDGSRKNVRAHRWSYEQFVGPIPSGFTIDHGCMARGCVNPEHLQAVSAAENTKRGWRPHKLTCVNGHLLFGDNLWLDVNGHRQCRICRNASLSAWGKRNPGYYKQWEEKNRLRRNAQQAERRRRKRVSGIN